ncbi:MAG TPA: phosphoglycolate phosphatase [Rhodospirillales bacterium]
MAGGNAVPFEALIFDLDGTLIDSAPDVCASINRVLTVKGRRAVTLNEAKDMVGWGGRVLVEKALALTGAPGTSEEIDDALDGFLATYAAHPVEHSTLFPGAWDALEGFRAAGIPMGICTNKPQATTRPVLEAMGLVGFFAVVACGDTVPRRKPDGEHVLGVVRALGAVAATAAMIGDSENDIAAAIDASVKSVAVTFGYAHLPYAKLGADALIDHFDELPAALSRIAQA